MDQLPLFFIARFTAASAWIFVVAKIGNTLSCGRTRFSISVQPKITPCAPASAKLLITLLNFSLDDAFTTPMQSS